MRRLLPLLAIFAAVFAPPIGEAFAQDVTSTTAAMDPSYLLGLGPIGALVWGAYLLGKGVNITLTVNLSEDDRRRLDRMITAVEGKVAA